MATPSKGTAPTFIEKLYSRLHRPVDAASIAVFRILLGIIVPLELIHYYFFDPFLKELYVNPVFHFKYPFFGWIPDMPPGMFKVFLVLLGLSFLMLAAGWFYRGIKWVCFLGYSYLFLMERASFLNHWYMVCLVCFLLLFIPANRMWSIDASQSKKPPSTWVPAWCLYLLLGLISVVYFYAGVVKLNPDWLAGQPMTIYLQQAATTAPDWLASLMREPSTGKFMAYSGLILELVMVPLLLWKPTRWPTFIITASFHFTNDYLFTVGLFPYLMLGATLLYFPPDWPRKLMGKLFKSAEWLQTTERPKGLIGPFHTRATLIFWGIFWAVQLLLPLRSTLYVGNQLWTEEGLLFSWKMMLEAKTGAPNDEILFWVFNVQDESYTKCDPLDYGLTWAQKNKLIRNPDLMVQYSRHLSHEFRKQGKINTKVYVDAFLGMNGRPIQRFIHPNVNLFLEPRRNFTPYPWVMPLINEKLDP